MTRQISQTPRKKSIKKKLIKKSAVWPLFVNDPCSSSNWSVYNFRILRRLNLVLDYNPTTFRSFLNWCLESLNYPKNNILCFLYRKITDVNMFMLLQLKIFKCKKSLEFESVAGSECLIGSTEQCLLYKFTCLLSHYFLKITISELV